VFAGMLNAQLAQFCGTRYAGAVGEWKRWASLFKHGDYDSHALLFLDT
jgi:hypothetical protein